MPKRTVPPRSLKSGRLREHADVIAHPSQDLTDTTRAEMKGKDGPSAKVPLADFFIYFFLLRLTSMLN